MVASFKAMPRLIIDRIDIAIGVDDEKEGIRTVAG